MPESSEMIEGPRRQIMRMRVGSMHKLVNASNVGAFGGCCMSGRDGAFLKTDEGIATATVNKMGLSVFPMKPSCARVQSLNSEPAGLAVHKYLHTHIRACTSADPQKRRRWRRQQRQRLLALVAHTATHTKKQEPKKPSQATKAVQESPEGTPSGVQELRTIRPTPMSSNLRALEITSLLSHPIYPFSSAFRLVRPLLLNCSIARGPQSWMTEDAVSRSGKLPLHIRSALRDDAEDEATAAQKSGLLNTCVRFFSLHALSFNFAGAALRPTTGKLTKKIQAFKALQGLSASCKLDSQLGGTLPRTFDILSVKELPGAFNLMTDSYLMTVAANTPTSQKAIGLPPVRLDSSTGTTRVAKSSLAGHISSVSNAMHLFKASEKPSSSNASLSSGTKLKTSQPALQVRDEILLDICRSAGVVDTGLEAKGDTLTSLVMQVPKSFRERSVNAMQLQICGHDSAEAKSIAEKNINQCVALSSQISGQRLPISSDFLKPLDFGTEAMSQMELDDPTILLLHGSGISLNEEVMLPDGCAIIQKHRKDGKNEIRINLSALPVERTEAQKSLGWFLKEWKKLEDFDADRSISNVQTAWAVLSISFMDITRQSFLICKERGVHLQHLWVHLSSFACRGITLAQNLASNFAAAEVTYLQKIRDFDSKFTSELDMLHKFYQKQLNLAWNTEERYKSIILGLEKDKTELITQLFAIRESALYSEIVALRTFYMNFAQNTKFLRDLIVDATTDWSKRASNSDQRWKAKNAGEVESVENIAITIGESDQQTWELKMNDILVNKSASDREIIALKESNALLTFEVTSLREQLEQYCPHLIVAVLFLFFIAVHLRCSSDQNLKQRLQISHNRCRLPIGRKKKLLKKRKKSSQR